MPSVPLAGKRLVPPVPLVPSVQPVLYIAINGYMLQTLIGAFLCRDRYHNSCQNILSEKEQRTFFWGQEVLMSPKDKLFRLVDNYLVIEV